MIKYKFMTKKDFFVEANDCIARNSTLGLVKLVKDASRLGLKTCKCDIVDEVLVYGRSITDFGTPTQVAEKLWVKMKEVMDKEYNNG